MPLTGAYTAATKDTAKYQPESEIAKALGMEAKAEHSAAEEKGFKLSSHFSTEGEMEPLSKLQHHHDVFKLEDALRKVRPPSRT